MLSAEGEVHQEPVARITDDTKVKKENFVMKRNDLLLIAACIILTVSAWLWINSPFRKDTAGEAVIYKDGVEYQNIPLNTDRTVVIEDKNGRKNIVAVKEGKVSMQEADCPDQVCVNTRPADREGQSIVCLPNRVVVEVRGSKKDIIDGVSE